MNQLSNSDLPSCYLMQLAINMYNSLPQPVPGRNNYTVSKIPTGTIFQNVHFLFRAKTCPLWYIQQGKISTNRQTSKDPCDCAAVYSKLQPSPFPKKLQYGTQLEKLVIHPDIWDVSMLPNSQLGSINKSIRILVKGHTKSHILCTVTKRES